MLSHDASSIREIEGQLTERSARDWIRAVSRLSQRGSEGLTLTTRGVQQGEEQSRGLMTGLAGSLMHSDTTHAIATAQEMNVLPEQSARVLRIFDQQ